MHENAELELERELVVFIRSGEPELKLYPSKVLYRNLILCSK